MKRPPPHLTSGATAVWKRLIDDPSIGHLFGPTDMLSFEIMCESYASWLEAKEAVKKFQAELIKKKLTAVQSRAEGRKLYAMNMTLRSAEATLRHWLVDIGMTPPSRSKVDKPVDGVEDEELDFDDLEPDAAAALRKALKPKKKTA